MEEHQIRYLPETYLKEYIKKGFLSFKDYTYLGAHPMEYEGFKGVSFMVLAPNAEKINLAGQFNAWDGSNHPMKKITGTHIWHIFIIGLDEMQLYKYEIFSRNGKRIFKADPYGFFSQVRPETASVYVPLDKYLWTDDEWINTKTGNINCADKTEKSINIYELHLGSWKRKENGDFLNYREISEILLEYVVSMGYTHIELLPVMEHPFDGSWGYQITGYFSVTSRYGTPEDFMYFVDKCHHKGIGVILDWVPGHFCRDEHGLANFDGAALYEYDDPVMADNRQWGTISFDHGKNEVIRFLISNAMFWFDVYHIDGLRVDAVSYMLYLDAGRAEGRWTPNRFGGNENLSAVKFLKKLNKTIHKYFPYALMIAEESTAWPNVTGAPRLGGLSFDLKWNMGWMNDVLKYMMLDPIYRKWHHHQICFSFVYAFSEKYILVLSHDEVVHGKKSLLDKMPGDYWSKFANLRALYGYMTAHPGKKHLFMGGEFGQYIEWNENKELDWLLLNYENHSKIQQYVRELNLFYREEKALHQLDHNPLGFEWIDSSNCEESIIVFLRRGADRKDFIIAACNFTPVIRIDYKIGVPFTGQYKEVFNSDLERYGGKGIANKNSANASELKWNNQPCSIKVTLPPLSTIFFKFIKKPENE